MRENSTEIDRSHPFKRGYWDAFEGKKNNVIAEKSTLDALEYHKGRIAATEELIANQNFSKNFSF